MKPEKENNYQILFGSNRREEVHSNAQRISGGANRLKGGRESLRSQGDKAKKDDIPEKSHIGRYDDMTKIILQRRKKT